MTENNSAVQFNGNTSQLRGLAIATTLLTFITLGIYRFWARTRVRRYFWSAVTLDGHGFEYTGKGIEKLIGFLIAVAVLAVYLGVFQALLSFAGMSLFEIVDPNAEYPWRPLLLTNVTFFALAPLIFYAQYRARRYMLSRTKWKGIRFGADQAALGYALRAIGHWILTIITLGILLPRQTFYLEKYKADRTWFGNAQFTQEGSWLSFYPAMKHILIGLVIAIIGGLVFVLNAAGNLEGGAADAAIAGGILGGIMIFIGIIWFYLGLAYYSVHSHRILTRGKKLGDDIRFTSEPRTARIIGIYLLGGLIISFIGSTVAGLVGGIFGILAEIVLGSADLGMGQEMPASILAGVVVGYVAFFVLIGILGLIFITQPIVEHFAQVTTVHNADRLNNVEQREGDEMIEAEGFADALDVGAGF